MSCWSFSNGRSGKHWVLLLIRRKKVPDGRVGAQLLWIQV
ncbi:hypothetical protein XAP412_430009 [Xanthomonas phaseoli pv. phaseoli]|uniref:Transposase n=1 Tax=Xanthomonas campestris pv. phaseoli TaxID=317013 RepID=A0AB38E0W4_XANCH|nr:hypothetical protein XAP6984_480010 [Xanthomonas phaseoli pv. phaseoli]SON85520.1 hypothetical protein XAP412_430009 [Xanthomonas phaseoli pv. phaseoli]SON90153.1 hypothetical protein XAP7430_450012 [Xanthomonas phaseoli pv. phaseoli]